MHIEEITLKRLELKTNNKVSLSDENIYKTSCCLPMDNDASTETQDLEKVENVGKRRTF